ncbi:EAL domain-containing protein [Kineosporia sp. NBRC 101677]|uniref:putative bifunctional diguanylate cyclase/phosphodiesterase n=1 Tax=Kineosporia sp. NBRC 101677 TaxID=3032197 RepID=UPI003330C20A
MARLPVSVLTAVLGVRLLLGGALARAERRSWIALSVAFACSLAARATSLWQAANSYLPPFPSASDYLYTLSLAAITIGVLLVPTARRSPAERLKLLVDALIVVAGACMVLWYLEIAPLLQIPGADLEVIAMATAVPVLDLLLLFALVILVLRRWDYGPGLSLLGGSVLLKVATDTLYIVAMVHFQVVFSPNGYPFLLWAIADYLMLLAVHRRIYQDDSPRGHGQRRPVFNWLPYGAIALAYGMLVYVGRDQSVYTLGGMIIGALVLTSLVITRQVIAQRESHRLAVTDPLTGLANRARINDRVAEMTRQPPRAGRCNAFFLIDLDHFKPINDAHGHEAGDAVLKAVATALRAVIRSGDTAGRLGGDEFAVVLPSLPSRAAAEAIAQRLVDALCTPVISGNLLLSVEASIGLAFQDETTTNRPDLLISHADVAMYAVKRSGRGSHCVYTPELDTRAREAELLAAVANDELVVHFQPVVALADGHEEAVEALVRWNHPTRGLLMPGAFIELAEETGAVVQIGEWVLREACRQASCWRREYPDAGDLRLSVNFSARQVTQAGIEKTIAQILDETGFPAELLILELTESVVLHSDEVTVARLKSLRDMGVALAVDDFGTGYAALSYLRVLPVTTLKIDRSFVTDIDADADAYAVTEALVRLGKAYKLRVVAEGVETAEQARCLVDMGCDFAQGYHFARPMPADAIDERLRLAGHTVSRDGVVRAGNAHLGGTH